MKRTDKGIIRAVVVLIVAASLLFLISLTATPSAKAASMISHSKAKRTALQFAPPRSRAVEVTSPEIRAQRTRAFFVHYTRTSAEALYGAPSVGHSALINSTGQVILSYYLSQQIIFQTGGNLTDLASWPLTRDGRVLPPGDSEVARFFSVVTALNAPRDRLSDSAFPEGDELLPGDTLSSFDGEATSDSDEPDAPGGQQTVFGTRAAGRIGLGFRIISIANRAGARETCGDNCGRSINLRFAPNRKPEPWCAWWATWVLRAAGIRDVPRTGSVKELYRWGESRGRITSTPGVGYLAFFRGYSHVGLVVGVNRQGNIVIVSGNTPLGGGVDGVKTKVKSPSKIIGYAKTYH